MDPIGITGLVVSSASLLFAGWQYIKANKAEKRLDQMIGQLPSLLAENMTKLLQGQTAESTDIREIRSTDLSHSATYADIDNDSDEELIVQFPYGVHGTTLQVFSLKGYKFQLIAELYADTPAAFEIEDVDNDGLTEVRTFENNKSSGMPYVAGLRDEVWYRLVNGKFVEIKRIEPSENEINERKLLFEKGEL